MIPATCSNNVHPRRKGKRVHETACDGALQAGLRNRAPEWRETMYLDDYKRWLAADLLDCDLNAELQSIADDDEAIKERFAVAL